MVKSLIQDDTMVKALNIAQYACCRDNAYVFCS